MYLTGTTTDHIVELSLADRTRIFNLGYYTWVEQQGVTMADFDARRATSFWDHLHTMAPGWDAMIDEFNAATGVTFF